MRTAPDRSGLFVGQVHLADKGVVDFNFLPAVLVLVVAALMHYDLLDKLPQQGGGQLLKADMDDRQVKATINSQVLWVFFIPLGMTLLHMLFASKIMSCMLGTFQLNDYGLILRCIGATCAAFMLLYLIVYKLTARVYYKIVRW